ncbi:MAG: hypothetical protein ACYSWU_09825, partial [Planctomycetota bacterium]
MMHVRLSLVLALLFLVLPICGMPAEQPGAAPKPGPMKAEFGRLLAEWNGLLAELIILQDEYRKADEKGRAEIQKKWDALIEKGDTLEPQLIAAAEKAYAEAPGADEAVTDLLIDVTIGHVRTRVLGPAKARFVQEQTDDYEEA